MTMKQLSIEEKELLLKEKAKHYDEVVNKLKGFMAQGVDPLITRADVKDFFPELEESEDDMIRKEIIAFLKEGKPYHCPNSVKRQEWAVWLAKQGEQKLVKCNMEWYDFVRWFVKERTNNYTLIPSDADIHTWGDIILEHAKNELEKQGEQNLADKIEPKFKKGDWVVYDGFTYQITEVYEDGYSNDKQGFIPLKYQDEMRLWNFSKDVKVGDILAAEVIDEKYSSPFIAIYKERGLDFFNSYCFVALNGEFVDEGVTGHDIKDIHPATKEQRDILFTKMKEAGYIFDFEKKELKKIEQKHAENSGKKSDDVIEEKNMTEYNKGFECGKQRVLKYLDDFNLCKKFAWSEEDERILIEMLAIFGIENFEGYNIGKNNEDALKFLKSLKDRVQPQPKQEWSEEDEYYRNIIMYCLNGECVGNADKENAVLWLKSLKERIGNFDDGYKVGFSAAKYNQWKPSELQMNAILDALDYLGSGTEIVRKYLMSLYEQLKKLREE